MKKVVIIGADGFLGRNLSNHLASLGINVIAMVYRGIDRSILKDHPNIIYLEFELSELESIDSISYIQGADIIYHMAWTGVSSLLKNEAVTQAKNAVYGVSVMEFAQKHNINKVLIPGSAAEYSCGNEIIDGKNYPSPSDMYSAAKVATRFLCQTYALQHNIDLIWTSITSIYGPGRDDNNLITYTIKQLLQKEHPLFTGLEQKWDYLYIDDLILALIALGEKGHGGKVYPIGSGTHRKMREYVEIIRNNINSELPIGIGELPYKTSTIDNQVMDITDLTKDTGFTPKYTFEEGIKLTIDYFKEQIFT